MLNKLNTNHMLQMRRPGKSISPDWCVMCRSHADSHDHMFLHSDSARCLWHNLFGVEAEVWVSPAIVTSFLQVKYRGFGKGMNRSILLQCGVFTILWCIWTEHNSRIFKEKALSLSLLWDRVVLLASLSRGAFNGVLISNIKRDWSALLL